VWERWWVSRDATWECKQILVTRVTSDEVKEPSSLGPRVGAVVGIARCNLGMQANLGDGGDEGKAPSSLEPRVGAAVGVERCNLGMQNLATGVTKAKSHHRWSRVCACGSGGGCRKVQLGDATPGARVLATGVTKAKSHHRWSRVWERRWVSRGATWECKTWRRG
jgi:hypothetical protein